MAIVAEIKETREYKKKVGLFLGEVIMINPTREELNDFYKQTKDKEPVYLSTDADGFDQVRVDFYLRAHKDNDMFIMSFYIKNKPKKDRSGSKFLFINTVAQDRKSTRLNSSHT